ncbi:MAG: SMI1/KNR4 family protein [Planctomycetaceae bacterium]
MSVQWTHLTPVAPLPDDMITGAELLLGVKFPTDYRDCLRTNHCGYPSPSEFVVPVEGRPFRSSLGTLLTIDPRAEYFNIFNYLPPMANEHHLPPTIIPIAQDGGGDFVCLDYRQSSIPTIVYWHHEVSGVEGITPLAGTFSELLASMQPEEVSI